MRPVACTTELLGRTATTVALVLAVARALTPKLSGVETVIVVTGSGVAVDATVAAGIGINVEKGTMPAVVMVVVAVSASGLVSAVVVESGTVRSVAVATVVTVTAGATATGFPQSAIKPLSQRKVVATSAAATSSPVADSPSAPSSTRALSLVITAVLSKGPNSPK